MHRLIPAPNDIVYTRVVCNPGGGLSDGLASVTLKDQQF